MTHISHHRGVCMEVEVHVCPIALRAEAVDCMQSGSIIVTGVGSVLMMKGAYPEWSFFTGGTLIYMGTIVLEAVSLSLTTKVRRVDALPQRATTVLLCT